MKKNFFVAFITVIMLGNCSNGNIKAIFVPLSEAEINNLKFLREEEKLAHDVYLYAYNKYEVVIFNNISQSEKRHMNSVLNLMNKYGIPDSASIKTGVFNNSDLQKLYNSLTKQADISLVEALKAGATIEDLDINDIDDFTANTAKPDLLNVYGNLNCGSKNHIRAFTSWLKNKDVIYAPQYISVEEYNDILSSSNGGCGNKK